MPPESQRATMASRPAPGRRLLLAIPLALLALIGVEWLWTTWRQAAQPSAGAEWIWIRGSNRWTGPRAFYALRDFDLDTVPAAATLSALGDEEYVLYLNGSRVGSNRYAPGAQLDRYEISPLLRTGRNRLIVHLRSTYSYGGFLAILRDGRSAEPIVVTNSEWRISRRRIARLSQPELDIDRPEKAIVVARPPEGRWGSVRTGATLPLHADLARDRPTMGARLMQLPGRQWRRRHPHRPFRVRTLGEHVTFDWEERQTGYLTLSFPSGEGAAGLVYLGLGPPDPLLRPPDATVITSPGESRWEDSVPRSFRYALVVGIDQITDARIVRTDPGKRAPVVAGEGDRGVFGLAAPRLRTAIEDVVWGKLESFARDTEGES